MSNTTNAVSSVTKTKLKTQLIRNTSTKSEKENGRASYTAVFSSKEILKLNTLKNLRIHIGEHNPRKRNHVHKAMADTIKNKHDLFPQLNGGLVIIASEIKINNESGEITLLDESLINGAQTQGEIKLYYAQLDAQAEEEGDESPVHPEFDVKAEILINKEDAEVAEIAIARNTQTPVQTISMAGARGQLDELYNRMNSHNPNYRVEKSETDQHDAVSDANIGTAFLLQIIRLMTPTDLVMQDGSEKNASEVLKPYKNAAQCLADFCLWESSKDSDPRSKALYDFTIQIAPVAWEEYLAWKSHPKWIGTNLKTKYKTSNKKIGTRTSTGWKDICNGLLFPVLHCLANFVVKDVSGDWKLNKSSHYDEARVLNKAVEILTGTDYYYDPMLMGRSIGAYQTLNEYPKTLVEVLGLNS
tara:strand:- start:409 stop:1653 length:1245 start_codon:yes stop_codon:yes gene_type:complete